MHLNKTIRYFLLHILAIATSVLGTTSLANAQSNQCQLQNTFPEDKLYPSSHFGASRSGGARWHAGVDFFYPKGTKVTVPQGCQIRLYSDGTVIWKSDPTGYGQYMFLDCVVGGVPLTLRYAHIAQYITSEAAIEQGRTGIETATIPDHYHFEVLINQTAGKGTPVDPECVLGIDKNDGGPSSPIAECNTCPTGPGPVDFCKDSDAVAQLIAHSQQCYKGKDKNNPGGSTVDPNQLRTVPNQGDPGSTVGPADGAATTIYDNDHVYTDPSDGSAYTGNVNDLYPPLTEPPPIQPPPPPVPGTPGDSSTLVPETNNAHDELTGCATDTWAAMVNQAVLQTRREDIYNKRYIVKPDSILKYSCYDLWYSRIGALAGPIFSETSVWDARSVDLYGKTVTVRLGTQDQIGAPFNAEDGYNFQRTVMNSTGGTITYKVLGPSSLDVALDSVIAYAANSYIGNNFNNNYLAETTAVATPSAGNCNVMNNVWQAAKCRNFDGTNVFMTFEELATADDPRQFPTNMICN